MLSKSVKILGILGWASYVAVSYVLFLYMFPVVSRELYRRLVQYMPPERVKAIIAMMPYTSLVSQIFITLIIWAIEALILFGLLKVLAPEDIKPNIRYGSTFLLLGHGFYIAAIFNAIGTWLLGASPLFSGNMVYVIPLNIATVILSSLYVALLLSKEYGVGYGRCFVATVLSIGIMIAIAVAMTVAFAHMYSLGA